MDIQSLINLVACHVYKWVIMFAACGSLIKKRNILLCQGILVVLTFTESHLFTLKTRFGLFGQICTRPLHIFFTMEYMKITLLPALTLNVNIELMHTISVLLNSGENYSEIVIHQYSIICLFVLIDRQRLH